MVTRNDISTAIRSLGVRPGDVMIAHASYKSFGGVEGGPRAVAEAILDAVAPGGSVFVPTFTYARGVFDPATSPSHDGIVTEMFRLLPGVERSRHPTHSLAGAGPDSVAILDGHERVEPFGRGSPVWQLWERNAWVLLIGVGHFANSMAHVAEELLSMPYLDRTRVALVCGPEGSQKLRVRRPGCSDAWDAVLAPAMRIKAADAMVGESRFQLMRARDVVDATVALLKRDPRALLCERPDCDACIQARAMLG